MTKQKNIKENETPINALPKYEIRTMKDDLAEASPASPEKLPVTEKAPTPPEKLPVVEELKIEKPPEKIPEPPKPTKLKVPKPKKPKIRRKTNFLILLIIFLIAIGFSAIVYWQVDKEPTVSLQPPKQLTPTESLISVNQVVTISLTPKTFLGWIHEEIQKDQLTGTFKRIVVLKDETSYLSLAELIEELVIDIPPYALSELGPNYTLALYDQDGMRKLVLVAEVKNIDNIKEQLGFWEQTLEMHADLINFMLIDMLPIPATAEFQNNIYKETNIRYINFPDPDLTIDYAIKNNLFILTTSRESMYKTIDAVDNL